MTIDPKQVDDDFDGLPDRWVNGDPVVGKFLEFRVKKYKETDLSMDPAEYVAGGNKMIPLHKPSEEDLANALHRTFEFERQPTDDKPWVIETDGGKGFGMDPRRLSAAPSKNSGGLEVWRILNSGTWSHPVHIHFEEGIILRRDGVAPPEWEQWARKDVYRIGPQPDSGSIVEVALRFREFAGTYMEHCHNTQHEDHAMLLRWDVEHPGQVQLMPTPIPSWDGVSYVSTVALPTARIGDGVGEFGPELDSVSVWNSAVIGQLDNIRDEFLGDTLNPQLNNERGTATFALSKGTNIDADGNKTEVFFFLHDVSDEELAEEMNLAWAGALANTPVAATAEASVKKKGKKLEWTFYGDLPNPVWANPDCRIGEGAGCFNPAGIPDVDDNNTYSPLRRVNIDGKDVVFNAVIVKWGDEPWEQNRQDLSCVSFPDVGGENGGPNGSCPYNGTEWGRIDSSGHVVAMDTSGPNPYVSFKLHKSWSGDGDYLPYYIVLDTFPFPPSRAMGVPYVPKHQYLGEVAVPLVQFVPGHRIDPTFPPMPQPATADGGEDFGLNEGGGPFGSQVGLPSYFMPEDDYSPMWHIGFAHWLEPADRAVKGFKELKELRAAGRLEILEWQAPPRIAQGDNTGIRVDDYDFENLNSPHVVNCPTPMTVDRAIHNASLKLRGLPTE